MAFVTSTLLPQQAFRPLRPAEKERGQSQQPVLEVEARLWEDPFATMRRFEKEQQERCATYKVDANAASAAPTTDTYKMTCDDVVIRDRRAPGKLLSTLDRDKDGDLSESLLLLVTLPGNAFVGAEESRRRTRHAVLAGLQAHGLAPDDAEHFGLLDFKLPTREPGSQDQKQTQALRVPYEMLAQQPTLRGDGDTQGRQLRFKQAAVLWVDESALPRPGGLYAFASLVGQVMTPQDKSPQGTRADSPRPRGDHEGQRHLPRLAVIGPSSSDILRTNLQDLDDVAANCPSRVVNAKDLSAASADQSSTGQPAPAAPAPLQARCKLNNMVAEGFLHLLRGSIYNATATAANRTMQELHDQELESFLYDRLARISDVPPPDKLDYKRTMATDDRVLRSLVTELQLRLPGNATRRIVLIAERDSLYAKALVSELKFRLGDVKSQQYNPRLKLETLYYYRGIDGVTIYDSEVARARAPGSKDKDGAPSLEWPEARDQFDYLRRQALNLKASEAASPDEGGGPIGAIGLLGVDVHDKLLALQALHDSFSDKVFFTTDMDARYLHPDTLTHTRNLIVASSLPLAFADRSVQAGSPPFRDVYQTSVFAATQLAACRASETCKRIKAVVNQAIDNPSVYEIGRSSAVPLAGYEHMTHVRDDHARRAALVLPLWLILAAGLLFWPSSPSIRRVRAWLFDKSPGAQGHPLPGLTHCLLAVLHLTILAYALGNAVEFAVPGRLKLWGVMLLTSVVAILALLLLLGRAARRHDDGGAPPLPNWLAWAFVALLGLGAAAWIGWPASSSEPCQQCEPAALLEGISAWPSHFIHVIALLVLVFILDLQWARIRTLFEADQAWLKLRVDVDMTKASQRGGLLGWWRHRSLIGWTLPRSGSVQMQQLWTELTIRGEPAARMSRAASAYLITAGLMLGLFHAMSDGIMPEVPVRGFDHRALVRVTLYTLLALLPALMVAVADATMLTFRFTQGMDSGRSHYPLETLQHFATYLGHNQGDSSWLTVVSAEPHHRDSVLAIGPPIGHTLLDDWIDIQLVARRTAAVAPLILGPLVIVALMVVARSRLFDNWALTLPVALGICAYLAWLVVLAVLLKLAAEKARDNALKRMQADLLWLNGAGDDWAALVKPFERLVEAVKSNRDGSFAPLFEQPLFRGLLVPLGGIGGTQLFDYLLLAR